MIEISGWFLSHHISCQSDPNLLTILVTVSRNFQVFPDILNAKEKMRMRILIVEDEKDLANVLSEMLELEGYHTDIANDGEYGLDCAMTGIYDLIILDIMLPKLDGIAVLRKLWQKQIISAVLMLTLWKCF